MSNAKRVTYLKARIEDKPGSFLGIMKDLKEKKLGLACGWAFPSGAGWTNLYVVPGKQEKVRDLWKKSSLLEEEGTAFFVKGTDRAGVLVKTLEAIKQAGVNLILTGAVTLGGKYGAFFVVAPGDVEKMARAIGAK